MQSTAVWFFCSKKEEEDWRNKRETEIGRKSLPVRANLGGGGLHRPSSKYLQLQFNARNGTNRFGLQRSRRQHPTGFFMRLETFLVVFLFNLLFCLRGGAGGLVVGLGALYGRSVPFQDRLTSSFLPPLSQSTTPLMVISLSLSLSKSSISSCWWCWWPSLWNVYAAARRRRRNLQIFAGLGDSPTRDLCAYTAVSWPIAISFSLAFQLFRSDILGKLFPMEETDIIRWLSPAFKIYGVSIIISTILRRKNFALFYSVEGEVGSAVFANGRWKTGAKSKQSVAHYICVLSRATHKGSRGSLFE